MYSTENGEYIRHSSVVIDHRDNQIKVSKDFTWYCIYWTVWTSNRETASSERCCVLYAIPVASWPSRESDAYDKWIRCTAIKRIGWTLAFLQCVHNWRETYSEKKSVVAAMSSRTVVKPGRIGKLTSGRKECPRTTTSWNQLYLIFRHKTDSARVISKSNMVWRWYL